MQAKVLILAGGGGHTGYAYALAQRLEHKAALSFLVPENDQLSLKRLSRFGDVYFSVKPRGPETPTRKFLLGLSRAAAESLRKVTRRYDVVVSTGSNFCIPPALSARLKGIPVVNVESSVRFTKASKTALLLQPFSTVTALHWTEQKRLLKRGTVFGPLLPKPEVQPWNGGYVLVTGGTFGHKQLFNVVSESSMENVVLQTGRIDPAPYVRRHPEWKVIRFSTRFYELVAGASLVVTHFGSTALEALVYGKPMVIVLNPEWKRTVGLSDAEIFARKVNAAFLWDLSLDNLIRSVHDAEKRKPPVFVDGAERLANTILSLAG